MFYDLFATLTYTSNPLLTPLLLSTKIDKHSDFGARLRLNAGAESQERILSGADSITSDIEHTDYEGLVIENYKRNLRGYSPDSVDLKGHSPDIPEPMVSRYSKHLADGSPKSGSLKNQGTWAETSVIEKISIPETKEEFEMTLTRSPDFLIVRFDDITYSSS